MASYLSEGSEVKKLQKKLEESKQQMAKVEVRLVEQQKLVESAQAQAKSAGDKVQRMAVLNELLSPLNREKKAIMGDLLKDIRTANLKEAYNRYLPTVMSGPGNVAGTKVALSETTAKRGVATGDRQTKTETTQALMEGAADTDIGTILYLAGINNVAKEH